MSSPLLSDRVLLLPRNHREVDHLPGAVFACDFDATVAGRQVHEHGVEEPWGTSWGAVLNVDHHGESERFHRHVSSGNLAIAWVAANGVVPPDATICVNHTDCDSMVSAAILAGRLPADERMSRAVIAADHTGDEDPLADVLQALDGQRDLDLSLDAAWRVLDGRPLPPEVQAALDHRRRQRDLARELMARSPDAVQDGIAFLVLDRPMDGEYYLPLVPEAELLLLAFRRPDDPTRWVMRLRLVRPRQIRTLFELRMEQMDPGMRGRWNAMSNSRAGGTGVEPEHYLEAMRRRLADPETGEDGGLPTDRPGLPDEGLEGQQVRPD